MKLHRPRYRNVAGVLIATSVVTGVITVIARAASGGSTTLRLLEAATLLLAAAAYLLYVLAHHTEVREVAWSSPALVDIC